MGNVLAALLDQSHHLHPDDLPALVAGQLLALGGGDGVIYLVDLDQRSLVPLPGGPVAHPPLLAVEGTLPGRGFRSLVVVSTEDPDGRRLWLPLLDGGERVGLLAVTVPDEDPATVAGLEKVAALVAQLVVTKSQYGDGFVRARRRREVSLAAELRWALLPPLTCSAQAVTIAGVLEPAYEIAGDAFDYSVDGDTAHVAIVDAMGHGLEASRIANLGVCAYRNARRRGVGMGPTFHAMDEAVADQFGQERFLTGQLAQLSLSTGVLRLLNAGHPRPILLRRNQDVGELNCQTCLPIGLGEVTTEVARVDLEPGDSLLFFTDGVIEARSAEGVAFGRRRLGDLLAQVSSSGEAPAEIMRRLSHAVLDHGGPELRDDATLLMVRWSGPGPAGAGGGRGARSAELGPPRLRGPAATAGAPDPTALRLGGAAPDPLVLTGLEREVQALLPDRAAGADSEGRCRGRFAFGEEDVGVDGPAGGVGLPFEVAGAHVGPFGESGGTTERATPAFPVGRR